MEYIVLRLTGPEMNETEIKQTIDVLENEGYHSALSRCLKEAQDDFNTLLTDIIEVEKRRLEGTIAERKTKKMKRESV